MRLNRWIAFVAVVYLSLSLSACSHFRKAQDPTTVSLASARGDDGAPVSGEAVPLGAGGGTLLSKDGASAARCVADADCSPGERCEAGTCAAGASDCGVLPTVHFGFDEADLFDEATARQLAECLRGRALSSASIEGFADERGATDYNLALSYKRAQALRATLVREGVSIPLNVVAWGEAFPAVPRHDEAAWAENRRAVATPTGQLLADGRQRAGK